MSFNTALSGLNAASADLGVVANNIANASTTGFKESRAEFSDIYPATNLGTTSNPIGSGVRVASVSQQFTQGNIEFSENNLDLAISGRGFFRLNDNGTVIYSRAGAFKADREGNIVNSANQRLTAYQADGNGNITGTLGDIKLTTEDIAPSATSTVDALINLNANATGFTPYPAASPAFNRNDPATYTNSTSLSVYDSLGNALVQTMFFRKTTTPNTWEMHSWLTNGSGNQVEMIPTGQVAGQPATVTFNNAGALTSVNPPVPGQLAVDYQAVNPGTGASNLTLDVNMNGTTQFGAGFSVNSLLQDGFGSGRLSGIDIGDTGVVQARYSNGQSKTMAQLALANFSNPQGMQQLGDTNWAETYDSGAALVGTPGSASLGLVQSGSLESSNVDLTDQLVSMITAQRNFQANAQVISVSDAITQTIINIR